MTTSIQQAKIFSSHTLENLREILSGANDDDYTIVAGGSLARFEASPESDFDHYIFGKDKAAIDRAVAFLKGKEEQILALNLRPPSEGGVFGAVGETHDDLLSNIGGVSDPNDKMTRRILFLLEGEWLSGKDKFSKYRNDVIVRYTPDHIRDEKSCRFLLNDIIRYYRTICVDFEYKTTEDSKPWGIRYIKLRFSRKLLYFGGIIAVAETVGHRREKKIERLIELLELPTIERVSSIFGSKSEPAIELYDKFLQQMSQKEFREQLKTVNANPETHIADFKTLRELSSKFTDELATLLRDHYGPSHPIHRALIF